MKKLAINIILWIPVSLFGQGLVQETPKYFGEIDSIIEVTDKNHNNDTSNLYSVTEKAKTIYKLNKDNLIKIIYTITESDTSYIQEYKYDTNKNVIRIKIDTYSFGKWGTTLNKYIYETKKRKKIKSFESWSNYNPKNIMKLNFFYDKVKYREEKLISFQEYIINNKGDTIPNEVYKIYYDTNNQIEYYDKVFYDSIPERIIFMDNKRIFPVLLDKPLISYRTEFSYDKKLILEKRLIGMEKERFENFQEEYSWYYEYDEKNNWTKCIEVQENTANRITIIRKIIYK